MYYSLTFNGEMNTWDNWRLIPAAPPMITPPDPVTNLVEIPGRRLGPIDLSLFPFNRVSYKRITGVWDFLRDTESTTMRVNMYETIRGYLHGKTCTVSLEEDPGHYFRGRFVVGVPKNGAGPTSIQIGYDLEPARFNQNGTIDNTWVTGL